MLRRALLAAALVLAATSGAEAKFISHARGAAVSGGPPVQTIASVPLSGSTFPPGSASGTVVGIIGTPVMSPVSPVFSGSCCTLSGADAASFQVVGSNLETQGVLCGSPPCTYNINLVATQGGISNSPFSQAVTITSTSVVAQMSFVNENAVATPGSTFPKHFLATFAPGAVPVGQIAVPSVNGSAIAYSADCAVDGMNPLRTDGCPSWPDGSLRAIPVSAFLPQLATAGATETVAFKVQSGSYSTTSTILPSSITAASDYNVVLTNVNSSWVPQNYGEWPNGVQIGCNVSGGSISGCTVRIAPPSVAGGNKCTTSPISLSIGSFTAKIDNGSGSPGNILTVTSGGGLISAIGTVRPEIITDTGGAIAANTVALSEITGTTFNVSGSPQLVAAEPMGLVGCSGRINNGVNNLGSGARAIFTTSLNGNGFPTSASVVVAGSGYSVVGSGTLKFDVNALLNLYGPIDAPTCAAESGAGVFSSVTYSGGAVTVNTVTSGHIATGQIIKDSVGATAVVTGTSSPWTVSAALTSGAMTANTPVCVHSSGPVSKGYWVFGPYIDTGSGLPDPQLMGEAEVDEWSQSGSPYSVRATIRTDREGWQPGQYWQSYTYNADIMNGTAEVRGNAQGTGVYTEITDEVPGDWWSVDPALAGPLGASAQMDWLGVTPNAFPASTSLAINAVAPYLAPGDIGYFRASRAMLPLNSSLTPTPTIIPTSSSGGNWDNPFNFQAHYQPFGPMWLDVNDAFGSGGTHTFLTPQGSNLSFWIDLTAKASDKGVSWLQQMRVSGLALSGDMAGASESDTGHAVNVDPNFSNAAFTDPVRLNSEVNVQYTTSVPATNMQLAGQINVHGEQGGPHPDTSHWPSGSLLGPYLVDGEYYQLKQMDLMAQLALWSETDDNGFRYLTYGGHTFYGTIWNQSATRTWAWGLALITQFMTWAPPQEPDVQYWTWIAAHDNWAPYTAFFPFIGSWSTGSNFGSKLADWTAAGGCGSTIPAKLNVTGGPYSMGEVTWMCAYAAQELLLAQNWELPGTNTDLDFLVAAATDKFLVKDGSQNSCPYNAVNYTQVTGNTATQAPNTSLDVTDIPGSPPGSFGQVPIGVNPNSSLQSVAGSSVVTFTQTGGGNNPQAPIPSGSILNPTQWDGTNEDAGNPVPPPEFGQGTWYKWCSTSAAPAASFTGTTAGTALTVSSSTGIAVGQFLAGAGLTPQTYHIVSGAGLSWVLNASAGVIGPEAMTTLPTGTVNPYSISSCSSPAPITPSTTTRFQAGWIVNQICPAGNGDMAFPTDFAGNATYPATFWAAYNWRVAVGGSTSDTTAAINLFSPFYSGNPGGVWTTLPNWDACTAFSC